MGLISTPISSFQKSEAREVGRGALGAYLLLFCLRFQMYPIAIANTITSRITMIGAIIPTTVPTGAEDPGPVPASVGVALSDVEVVSVTVVMGVVELVTGFIISSERDGEIDDKLVLELLSPSRSNVDEGVI